MGEQRRTFEALAAAPQRRGGCRGCGAETAGVVNISCRRYGSPGALKGGGTVASKSVALCESCAVERYAQAADLLTRIGGSHD